MDGPQHKAMRELRLQFSDETYRMLEDLARRKGKTIPEVLGDAIALEKWIDDARARGERVLFERNGKYEELLSA